LETSSLSNAFRDQGPDPKETSMAMLRERWLETLATCVTVMLLGFVYIVLVDYDSGRSFGRHVTLVQTAGR
jgi:hypothetical protein